MLRHARCFVLLLCGVTIFAALALPAPSRAEDDKAAREIVGTKRHPLAPPDTSSPRATFQSFLTDANAAWGTYLKTVDREEADAGGAGRSVRRALRCIDMSEVPPAQRKKTGELTVVRLLDVFNRIELPAPRYVPTAEQMEAEGLSHWVIPHTRITIARVQEGPRQGEWLFTPDVVTSVKEFYERTRRLPLKPGALVKDGFKIYVALAGWMIPVDFIEALPDWAHLLFWEQTVWQWIGVGLVLVLSAALPWLAFRWSQRAAPGQRPSPRRALAAPLALIVAARTARYLIAFQLNLSGTPFGVLQTLLDSLFFVAAAWAIVLVGSVIAQSIVQSPRIKTESVNAHLIRIGARIASIILAILVVLEGARSLGIPVVGVVAGLGVGGLAIALAAQPTIENFIGGLTLFADRPVAIGDFCQFGEKLGTVEEIGLRSTRIRTLERSVLTVPNAEFSRLQLDNLTRRDRILFRTKLNLRLETTHAQLEQVLARVRALLLAHERVDPDPARVRLVDVGPHSLDLEIFAYLTTNDWNEFLGLREALYMGILREVEQAGTALAPPAWTNYLRSDAEPPDRPDPPDPPTA